MYQIFKKLLIVFLCLSLLSTFAFASAEPTPSAVVQWNCKYGSSNINGSFTLDGSSPSSSDKSLFGTVYFTSGSVTVGNSSSSTTVFQISPVPADFSASSSTSGYSVSSSVSNKVATITVVASSDRQSNICGIDFSGSGATVNSSNSISASGYTYNSSGGSVTPPVDEFAGTGSMFGWTGQTLFTLRFVDGMHWYTDGTGSSRVGHLDVVVENTEAQMPGYYARTAMLAALTYQKWKWAIDEKTGLPKFDVMQEQQGTWADMLYRTSVYNYFWGNKLWHNDVSGSWYGSISSDFSYLNFRVNQILSVLANDEDLAIKDATTPERDWVKNYFNGFGDKADTDKYDKLNNTGSAFKDAFAGAPDSSIADGFTAVNDNGYEFWSQGVSDDINGNSSSSSYSSRAPSYVPPDQRIVDAYSGNWDQIVGGYYD